MAVTRHAWLDAFATGLLIGLSAAFATGLVRGPGRGRRSPSETVSQGRPRPPSVSRGFRAAALRVFKAFNQDRIPAASAAVTYYMLLAIFPALSAFVSLYGLIADVEGARRRINALGAVLPREAIAVLGDQLGRLAAADHGALGVAFFVSLLVSVWSANAGLKALIAALNTAFERPESRGFVRLNLISLSFTAAALGLAVLLVAAVVQSSRFLDRFVPPGGAGGGVALWIGLPPTTMALIALLYRYAPAHREGRRRWFTIGGAMAALGWMAMTAGFSWFAGAFDHFDKVYGSLSAIVGFMTWIWLSLIVILAGAELDGDVERQRSPARSTPRAHPAWP